MFNRFHTVLAGAVVLASFATSASAETTTLTCTGGATGGMGLQTVLDMTAKTAAFGTEPAAAATFTDTDIFWQVDFTQGGTEINASYQLSRSTGAMTRDILEKGATNGQQHFVYSCAVAQKNKF
jgi:hypothetical protein